jgi:hypothetical protein
MGVAAGVTKDPVSPALHRSVVRRDGGCFIAKFDDRHECRDRWGTPHDPLKLALLTVDHFWWVVGGVKGKRAPSRREHLVAMCHAANVGAPSKDVRQRERDYARMLYPTHDCERDDAKAA